MAVVIRLPDMGTNVDECRLLAWRVQEGQHVRRGEVLAEIETDKAVAELESTAEGVLLRQAVKVGDRARMGDVLAYVGEPGESLPGSAVNVPPAHREAPTASGPAPQGCAGPLGALRVSPVVRNLAAKLGVDLAGVQGTGERGTITREDVLLASRKLREKAEWGDLS
jgi:pyruvate dehydrogenase E2 component (dihydrolipoyllysine-residue acetyltransferase)